MARAMREATGARAHHMVLAVGAQARGGAELAWRVNGGLHDGLWSRHASIRAPSGHGRRRARTIACLGREATGKVTKESRETSHQSPQPKRNVKHKKRHPRQQSAFLSTPSHRLRRRACGHALTRASA